MGFKHCMCSIYFFGYNKVKPGYRYLQNEFERLSMLLMGAAIEILFSIVVCLFITIHSIILIIKFSCTEMITEWENPILLQ